MKRNAPAGVWPECQECRGEGRMYVREGVICLSEMSQGLRWSQGPCP